MSLVPLEPYYTPNYNSILLDAGADFLINQCKYYDFVATFCKKVKLQTHVPAAGGIFLRYIMSCKMTLEKDPHNFLKISGGLITEEDVAFCWEFIKEDTKYLKFTSHQIALGRYNNHYLQSNIDPIELTQDKSLRVYHGAQIKFQKEMLYQTFTNLMTKKNTSLRVLNVGAGSDFLLCDWVSSFKLPYTIEFTQLDMYDAPQPSKFEASYQCHYVQDNFVNFLKKKRVGNFDLVMFMDSIYYIPFTLSQLKFHFKCPVLSFNYVFTKSFSILDKVKVIIEDGTIKGNLFDWKVNERVLSKKQFECNQVYYPINFLKSGTSNNIYVSQLLVPFYRMFSAGLYLKADSLTIEPIPSEQIVNLITVVDVDEKKFPVYRSVFCGVNENQTVMNFLREKTHYMAAKMDGLGAYLYGHRKQMHLQFKDGVILAVAALGKVNPLVYEDDWPVLYVEVLLTNYGYRIYFSDVVTRENVILSDANVLVGYSLHQTLRFVDFVNKMNGDKVFIGRKRYTLLNTLAIETKLDEVKPTDNNIDGIVLIPHYPIHTVFDEEVFCVKEVPIFDMLLNFKGGERKVREVLKKMTLPSFPPSDRELICDFIKTRAVFRDGKNLLVQFKEIVRCNMIFEVAIVIRKKNVASVLDELNGDFVFNKLVIQNQAKWLSEIFVSPKDFSISFVPLLPRPDKVAPQLPIIGKFVDFLACRTYRNIFKDFVTYLNGESGMEPDYRRLSFFSCIKLKVSGGFKSTDNLTEQKLRETVKMDKIVSEFGIYSLNVQLSKSLFYYSFEACVSDKIDFLKCLLKEMNSTSSLKVRQPVRVHDNDVLALSPLKSKDDVFYLSALEVKRAAKNSRNGKCSPLLVSVLVGMLYTDDEEVSTDFILQEDNTIYCMPNWVQKKDSKIVVEMRGVYFSKCQVTKLIDILQRQ